MMSSKTHRISASWSIDDADLNADGPLTWLLEHINEVRDRFYFLTAGKYSVRWSERDLYESMAAELTAEIDKDILESLRNLKEEDLL